MAYPELARVAGMNPKTVAASVRLMNMKLTDAKSVASRKMKAAELGIQSLET